jgi:hypothetical protein
MASARALLEEHWDPTRIDEPAMAWLGSDLARSMMLSGARSEAAPLAELVLAAAERAADMELVIESMNTLGTSRTAGHLHLPLAILKEAVSIAEEFGSLAALARALNNSIVIGWNNGKTSVRDQQERLTAVSQRLGSQDYISRTHLFWALHLHAEGDFEGARDILGSTTAEMREEYGLALIQALATWALDGATGDLLDAARRGLQVLPDREEDPQGYGYLHDFIAMASYLGNDLALATHAAEQTHKSGEIPSEYAIEVPLLIALETQDRDLLESTRLHIAPAGQRPRSFGVMADAVEQVLDGHPAGHRSVLDAAHLRAEVDGPLCGHLYVATLGLQDDTPEGREAVEGTRRWFEERGANGFLERFRAAWGNVLEADAG